jgi:tRNA-dihydrouridine synthase A
MREPGLVAECVAAMRAATSLPVTVKCRIGVDDSDEWAFLLAFVDRVAAAGCGTFAVHARKAWLKGLSPKENREIPPLRYEIVERLKRERPALEILLNGGLTDPERAADARRWADGVMIGRAAYHDPWSLRRFEAAVLGNAPPATGRGEIVAGMAAYAARQLDGGVPLKAIARHMLGLFNGLPGARAWRRRLSEGMRHPAAGPELLHDAMRAVSPGLAEAA